MYNKKIVITFIINSEWKYNNVMLIFKNHNPNKNVINQIDINYILEIDI